MASIRNLLGLAATFITLQHTSQQQCTDCPDIFNVPDHQKYSHGTCKFSTTFSAQGDCRTEFYCSHLQKMPNFTAVCEVRNRPLDRVELSQSVLKRIPPFAFVGLQFKSHWPELVIQDSQISSIEEGAFRKSSLPDVLYQLDLTSNKLTSVSSLLDLINLEVLILDDNHLANLPENMPQKLTKLKAIHLQKNDFVAVPSHICNFHHMTEIRLGWNTGITADLSEMLPLFTQCKAEMGLQLMWPRKTLKCSCSTLIPVGHLQITAECVNAQCSGLYTGVTGSPRSKPVTCSNLSKEEFVGKTFNKIGVDNMLEICVKDKLKDSPGKELGKKVVSGGVMLNCGTFLLGFLSVFQML